MDDILKVNESYYLLVLETKVQELTKDNLMSQAMIRQLMDENQNLITMYNDLKNNVQKNENNKGEKEGE